MEELARRRIKLPPPPRVLWADLAAPRQRGARTWLVLQDGEKWPKTVESVENERVVWSSLWTARPRDRIIFEISPDHQGSSVVEYVWKAAEPFPEHVSPLRHRLSQLVAAELRYTYGQ